MSVLGIDEITFGAQDIARCRQFFLDWGLTLVEETPTRLLYESLNGCRVIVAHSDTPGLPAGVEADPTLREVVWGVEGEADLEALLKLAAAAISRLQTHQLSSLAQSQVGPDGNLLTTWQLELPMRNQQELVPLQVKIQRDEGNPQGKPEKRNRCGRSNWLLIWIH